MSLEHPSEYDLQIWEGVSAALRRRGLDPALSDEEKREASIAVYYTTGGMNTKYLGGANAVERCRESPEDKAKRLAEQDAGLERWMEEWIDKPRVLRSLEVYHVPGRGDVHLVECPFDCAFGDMSPWDGRWQLEGDDGLYCVRGIEANAVMRIRRGQKVGVLLERIEKETP